MPHWGFYALIGFFLSLALWFALSPARGSAKRATRGLGRSLTPAVSPPQSAGSPNIAADAPATAVVSPPAELAALSLARPKDLDDVHRSAVEALCTSMGDPHPVHLQLATGLDSPDELKEVVTSDAGLTAGILRTVNSAAFSLASPITSVQHAITYLGVSAVKGLVLRAATSEGSEVGTREQQEALSRIWKSAYAASSMAQLLGQEVGVSRPSVLATRALFFNLGDVALATGIADSGPWYQIGVSIVDRVQVQQQACGANAAIVGAALASRWHLPEDIVSAIESGLLPLVTPPGEHPMTGEHLRDNVLMYLAGRIGDRVAYRGLKDVGELPLATADEPDLYYLLWHLEAAGLQRVPGFLKDPTFRRKANRMLQVLGT